MKASDETDLHSRCLERKIDSINRHWRNCAVAQTTLRGARSLRNHGTLTHATLLPHPKAMPRQGILLGPGIAMAQYTMNVSVLLPHPETVPRQGILLGPGIATAQCTMNVSVATGVRHGV